MILTVTIVSLLSGSPCTLSGKVELRRDGKQIDASGRVAVYVEQVSPKLWSLVKNQTHSILQVGLQFQPQVLVVLKGDSVQFTNEDKDEHNVFSNDAVPKFDFPKSSQGVTGKPVTFVATGPARIQCNIHEWMRSDILVVQNPFFTLVEADGSFRIPNLPAGDYVLKAWEPNGAQVSTKVKRCARTTQVALPALEEARLARPRRLDGGMYPVYPR